MFFKADWEVAGISLHGKTHSPDRPFPVHACDVRIASVVDSLPLPTRPDLLIHCVSTRGGSPSDYRSLYHQGLLNLLGHFQPKSTLFVSSTSVYGQTRGEWVDEESATCPSSETSQILLEAENECLMRRGTVVRLAGLYGPGRSGLIQRYLAGNTPVNDLDQWINLIHRDDAAEAIFHLGSLPERSGIFNVADGQPLLRRQIHEVLTTRLPVRQSPQTPVRKRGFSNKRIQTGKLRKTGWRPAHPDFRNEIPALLDALTHR